MLNKNLMPTIVAPTKFTSAACCEIYEEIQSAFNFIEVMATQLNPLQQELVSRFRSFSVRFGHDLLLADKDLTEIRRRIGLPLTVCKEQEVIDPA